MNDSFQIILNQQEYKKYKNNEVLIEKLRFNNQQLKNQIDIQKRDHQQQTKNYHIQIKELSKNSLRLSKTIIKEEEKYQKLQEDYYIRQRQLLQRCLTISLQMQTMNHVVQSNKKQLKTIGQMQKIKLIQINKEKSELERQIKLKSCQITELIQQLNLFKQNNIAYLSQMQNKQEKEKCLQVKYNEQNRKWQEVIQNQYQKYVQLVNNMNKLQQVHLINIQQLKKNYEEKINTLQTELNEENERFTQKLNQKQKKNKNLIQKVKKLVQNKKVLEQQKQYVIQLNQSIQKQLRSLEEVIGEKQKLISQKNSQISDLQCSLFLKQQQTKDYNHKNSQIKQFYDEMKKQYQQYKVQISDIKHKLQTERSSKEQLKAFNQKKLSKYQQSIFKLQSQLRQLKSFNTEHRQLIQNNKKSFNEKLSKLSQEINTKYIFPKHQKDESQKISNNKSQIKRTQEPNPNMTSQISYILAFINNIQKKMNPLSLQKWKTYEKDLQIKHKSLKQSIPNEPPVFYKQIIQIEFFKLLQKEQIKPQQKHLGLFNCYIKWIVSLR